MYLVGSLVACATGGKFQGTGANSEGGSGGGGGDGGGQTTTTTSAGGGGGQTTTTSSTTTSTSTSTPTCDESPCKLVNPQCGCPAGDMCAINQDLQRECTAPGSIPLGGACQFLYDCAPGGFCAGASSTKAICTEYCDDDAQCGQAICVIGLVDEQQNPVPGVTFCSDDCNPINNVGCPSGLTCLLGQEEDGQMRTFGICRGHGNGAQGTACTDNEDCAAGSACFTLNDPNMSKKCLAYCNTSSPSCPSGSSCTAFNPQFVYKNITFGACIGP
jgi:hypothetical protein